MRQQTAKTIHILAERYPQKPDMDLGNAPDSLLATIMSARTTDAQVLKMFPAFRKKFPDWESLVRAREESIAASISNIGLYKTKAKSIKALAQMILAEYGGRVPDSMGELVKLPGVGRKTASCVLSYCFHKPAVAVDTHVARIATRLGWAKGNTPEKIEEEIKAVVPEESWSEVNRTFVRFGREICVGGRKPKCWMCPVAKYCAHEPKTLEPKV